MESDPPPRNEDAQWRLSRRQSRKREIARRRKRGGAVAGLVVVVVVVLAVVALAGGASKVGRHETARRHDGARAKHGASQSAAGAKGGTGAGAKGGASALPSVARDAAATRLSAPGPAVAAPILIYHVINPPPAGAPFPGLYVPGEEFAEQMRALYRAGFYAVTLEQLWRHWHDGAALPKGRPIVISFDNGYQSQFTNALPVLRKYGWKGVENIQLTGLPPSQGGLSRTQVKGLVSDGWELDTQGFSHAELPALDAAELHYQVAVARKTVQRRYHVAVNWFCYPSGHYNATVQAAVQAAGYRGSTTVVPGWASPSSDPYRLPRLRVLGGTTGSELVALIEATKDDPGAPGSYE